MEFIRLLDCSNRIIEYNQVWIHHQPTPTHTAACCERMYNSHTVAGAMQGHGTQREDVTHSKLSQQGDERALPSRPHPSRDGALLYTYECWIASVRPQVSVRVARINANQLPSVMAYRDGDIRNHNHNTQHTHTDNTHFQAGRLVRNYGEPIPVPVPVLPNPPVPRSVANAVATSAT